ncbi:Hint domain-containing protein [Myxococcus landrumensis]|uniref:Hint domain-containing protein n=1 Tax=Myxococcus landrumensis TaxID=2813577 RepID=UPI001F50FE5A|nr:Hint domain-containing protein [Myxococcus landrumus]
MSLNQLESRDFVDAVEVDESVDQPVSAATVTLKRDVELFSTSPLRADSKLNATNGQLLTSGREFAIDAAVSPVGMSPSANEWHPLFHGVIDEVDFPDEQLVFRGRDLGGRLQDEMIQVERAYGETAGVAVETVMQSILTDNGVGVALHVPVSPGWRIRRFAQKKVSVLDALRDLAQQIGWEVRYRWREASGGYALTFSEPGRVNPSLAWTFGPGDYRAVSKLTINRTEVRNRIEVVYSDVGDLDVTNQAKRKSVVVEDAASQSAYGVRYMQLAEDASSNINSELEARKMADAALSDLKEPLADQEVETDFFLPVELGDLYRFRANGAHYSDDQHLAVTGFRHAFSAEGDAVTTITTRGRPSYGISTWLEMDTRPGMSEPAHTLPPFAALRVDVAPLVNGFSLAVTPALSGPPVAAYELHVSTLSGFAVSSSTLRGTFDTTAFGVSDLMPGSTYYVRVVPRDRYGNRGDASAQLVVVPKKLDGASLGDAAVGYQHLLYPPTDNLVPNGYNEAGLQAVGRFPDGDMLVEDPVNAREGRWVRRVELLTAGEWVGLNWSGGFGSSAPGRRIRCSAGDQFHAEVYVKASSAMAGWSGDLFLLWEGEDGVYTGRNTFTSIQNIGTTYQRVTVTGTCPAGCTGVELFWGAMIASSDVGKRLYFDAVSLRKMVTFDLLAANTLRTSNYSEDGNGIPTAGAKLDNVGTSLKVASNNVQVGRYYLSDGFFRSVQALADTGSRIYYRGNNDGAPNIDRLNIQVVEGYAMAGAAGGAGWLTWAHYMATIQPESASDNLDALRFMDVGFYWSYGDSNAPQWLYGTSVPLPDRKYQHGLHDADSGNSVSVGFSLIYGDKLNRLRDGLSPKMLYLKVRIHNASGFSAERWFYPPVGYNVNMARRETGPASAPSSGSGGGGLEHGTCVAPWEPVLLADGKELPAELLKPGMRVLTMHEHEADGGVFEVTRVSRHRAARCKLVMMDGRVLVVTPDHRWRTVERGWTRTDELRPGELIDGFAPGRVARVEPTDAGDVMMVTVRFAMTYMVRGLLAHNLKPRD